jgi:hypothetical protein
MPLAGWREDVLRAFLALSDIRAQATFWRERLDTWRFRTGFSAMMSAIGLRAVYARGFVDFLPPHFGSIVRARMARSFARHPNVSNPYAHALLLGEIPEVCAPPADASRIQLVLADAASYLEACPPRSFHAFTLSNILDGARPPYRDRLVDAVRRAATEDAVIVLRSFGEPKKGAPNLAGEDRAILWGRVDLHPAARWNDGKDS